AVAIVEAHDVGSAPARVVQGARVDEEPGAIGQADGGFPQRAIRCPGEVGDVPAPAVALGHAAPVRVAEDFGAGDLGHEPDDTMPDSFEEGPLIHEDLAWRSALEIAALVRDKQLSPVELTSSRLARIEAINPRLNAYCLVAADLARAAAKEAEIAVMKREPIGPLHGVPVSLKDMLYTRGMRTTGGSRLYADLIPEEDAVPVGRLRAAGAVVLGKTNTSEFGHKALTENLLFGPTRNPWDPERTPGGSSGGAAAAVA